MGSKRGFKFTVSGVREGHLEPVRRDTRVKAFVPGQRYLLKAPTKMFPKKWVTGSFVRMTDGFAEFTDLLGDADSIIVFELNQDKLYPFRAADLLADPKFVAVENV